MQLLILIPILLIALSIHEAAHAFVADKLGDPVPRAMGRVTLNPIKHLDPFGTAVLVFTALFAPITFGWGKPVLFNPANLKNPKKDSGLVAIAGPASNITMAIIGILLILVIKDPIVTSVLQVFITLNVILAAFNLLPIYPLDGFNFVTAFLPNNLSRDFAETARYGNIVLILLILTGAISKILMPVVSATFYLIKLVS